MLDKEKELNVMKSNFITMVSHEFRSPLTKIKSAAQMIEKFGNKLTDDEKNEYIKRIINIVDQMSGLLENVSLIGGTDLFDLVFEPKETDVLLLLNQLISNLNINYGKSDKIVLTTDSKKIVTVIDDRLFRIICFNALTNIIKNSNEEDQINIFIGDSDGELVLIINDIHLNVSKNEFEIIKRLVSEGKIIDDLPSTCINWSVVVKSVQIHKGSIKYFEKGENTFSIIINIPIISQKNKNE
jgi:K+-sensing histidine kinase KdpD